MDIKNVLIFVAGMVVMLGLSMMFDFSGDESHVSKTEPKHKKVLYDKDISDDKETESFTSDATKPVLSHKKSDKVKVMQVTSHKDVREQEVFDQDELLTKEYEELSADELNALPYEIRMDKIDELKEKWSGMSNMEQQKIVQHFRSSWSSLPEEDKVVLKEAWEQYRTEKNSQRKKGNREKFEEMTKNMSVEEIKEEWKRRRELKRQKLRESQSL